MNNKFCVKGIYNNGMVLQRNTTNSIFGDGEKNSKVDLSFRGESLSTTVNASGKWKIEFNPGEAGGPFTLTVCSGKDSITFNDVYVGEVWLSSGQSNSQLTMERLKFSYPEEFELPENPNIRMITIPIKWAFDGTKDSVENPVWNGVSPSTLGQMSGTSYFFAKKLYQELGVPVGIISCAQGGSPVTSWINKESLKNLENTNRFLSELESNENPDNVAKKIASLEENQRKWTETIESNDRGGKESWEKITYAEIQNDWEDCSIPGFIEHKETAGFLWMKKQIVLDDQQVKHFNEHKTWVWFGTIVDADKIWVNGVEIGGITYCYPPRRYVVPSGTLVKGRNTITIRVQKNTHFGHIRFYDEKPYFLFTDNVKICPTAVRNVEHFEEVLPEDGEKIPLSGPWKMKNGAAVEDAPAGYFFEWCPTALYNAMLSPCFNYAIAGALWYQGESDVWHSSEYYYLLQIMVKLWRQKFIYAKKNMPFVVIQLPNWSDGKSEDNVDCELGWADMRDAQARAVKSMDNVGIAITIDAGEWNDLHPEKKKTGGTRSALEALRIAYNKKLNYAPKFVSAEKKDNTFVVTYDCGTAKLKNYSGKEINGFYFVYEHEDQKKNVESKGLIISDNQVAVEIPEINGKLLELRYLYADSPKAPNLYSTDDLPAESFKVLI